MDRVSDILKKYDPSLKGKEYLAVFGAISMMTLVEGLKNAGKNLTQESLIKGSGDDQELETGGDRGRHNLLAHPASRVKCFSALTCRKRQTCSAF